MATASDRGMGDNELQRLFADIEQNIVLGKHTEGRRSLNIVRKTFKLLFRARTPEDLEQFHEQCDGKGPTLTVLHGKYNVWFGGYTSKSWSAGKKDVKSDERAFLFNKSDNKNDECKFFDIKDIHKDRAITCDRLFGPTFGGTTFKDYDLQTFNLTERTKSKMKGNYMRLNGTLNFGAAYKCKDHQPTKGEINGGKMDVKIIEVYQVVDDILEKEWREKPTDEVVSKKMDRLLKCESLAGFGIRSYNILLVGVIGAGKSSLCNTFVTLFAGECKTPATVGETTGSSVTNKLQWYTLNTTQTRGCVNIIDMRGYAPERTFEHELEHLLNGKLPTEYVFPKTAAPVSDYMLLKNPSLDDEVHLVCFVVDVEKLQVQQEVVEFQNSLSSIMETIRQKGIPVAAVATKIDKLCPRIDDDADNIYDSPKARDAVLRVAHSLGLEDKNVFPVVNFIKETKETTLSPAKRKLATEALDSMVHLAEDYIERHLQAKEKQKEKIGMKTIHSVIKELPDRTLKVLLVGEVNSGKSSFIDSVMTFMTGKPCHKAAGCSKIAENTRESITEKLHRLKYINANEIATTSNVLFGDMPGFQQTGGVELEHVKMVINGNVGDKCKIKYGLDKRSKRYKRKPTRRDRFNCVCIVMDIISVESVSQKTWKRLKNLVRWLQIKGIPFVVILTKIDQLNQLVQKGSQSVELYSRRPKQNNTVIRRNTDIIVEKLGIKESMFFPVQNYVDEKGVSSEIDVRLQNALQNIVELGREQMGDDDDEDDDDSTESSDFDDSEHVKDISLTQEHASSDERL